MNWNAIPEPARATDEDVLRNLFAAGWFADSGWDSVKELTLGSDATRRAVEGYRVFHGLEGSGVDDDLVTQLMRPRCALPDLIRSEEAGLAQWDRRLASVNCAQDVASLNPLASDVERNLYVQALTEWNKVCGIKLRLVGAYGSANINSGVGPTSGGVLAYSYLPGVNAGAGTKLSQVYGRSINWSPHLLLQVFIHEVGHAIGLDHGPSGSLMQPTASGSILKPQAWDIAQVYARYGNPEAGSDPSPIPGAPPPVPPTPPIVPGEPTETVLEVVGTLGAGRYRIVRDNSFWGA